MSDWREAKEARELEQGYQESSERDVRMRDWLFRKEADADGFAALCNRLHVEKWRREVYAEGGERLSQLRRRKRDWFREKGTYRPHPRKPAPVLTCELCAAQWSPVPWVRGMAHHARWCSNACRQRWHYRRRT